MPIRTRPLALVALAFALLTPSVAAAETAKVTDDEDGYVYDFHDDPLSAVGNSVLTAQIRVRAKGVRRTLIRPRMHFVPELLKSVENL